MLHSTALLFLAGTAGATTIPLVTFDGAAGTTHKFSELNDPVMGGKSVGSWSEADGVATFSGNVVNVPKLKAPGFIEGWADDGHYADASGAAGGSLVLTVRSSTPDYAGFRVSFASGALSPNFSCAAGGSIIGSRGCFKAHFAVPSTAAGAWATVRVPFADFTDKWSSYTGDATKTCAEDASCCVTAAKLKKIQAMGIWGEGKAGKVHLEIKSIVAEGPSSSSVLSSSGSVSAPSPSASSSLTRPPSKYDLCSDGVQSNLKYNISSLGPDALTAPVAVGLNESLATAICCDSRTLPFAEPRFLFQSPFINLFADLEGPTTFYDSVCGLPLFTAPQGRTMADFQADTNEHGWPSFRPAEIHADNVITNKTTGYVFSKCGTHLGSYLPDSKGARWCLDLSCLAGNKPQ